MSPRIRTFLVWVLLVLVFIGVWAALGRTEGAPPRESTETFYADLAAGRLAEVRVDQDSQVYGVRADGYVYSTALTYTESVDGALSAAGVPIQWWAEEEESTFESMLPYAIGIGVVLGLLVVFFRRLRSGQANILSLRRTTARLVAERPKVGWDDVGGAEEAKRYLRDTVDFLRSPATWQAAGARAPRGILLEGPPGYGKTLIAKALASEARLPFFEVSATEFVELFVGVGAARVRDLFDEAKKKAPSVIFIDEIDAVGRRRGGASTSLTHQEREQALDQLLVCLDGFTPRDSVVVLAATNRADVLDPALLRPGRFDMTLRVGEFSEADRLAIFGIHTKGKPLGKDVDLGKLAAMTAGRSGADIEQIVNGAAMAAARRKDAKPQILQADLEEATRAHRKSGAGLDRLDLFLAESGTGLAKPTQELELEVLLRTGDALRGRAVWADPHSLKLATETGPVVLSRFQLISIRAIGEPLAATDAEVQTATHTDQPDAG